MMSKSDSAQRVKIAGEVTAEHGRKFAEAWLAMSLDSEIAGLCHVAGIMEWPERNLFAQENHQAISHEITRRTLAAMKDAIAETFVREAQAVFERETRPTRVVVVWPKEEVKTKPTPRRRRKK